MFVDAQRCSASQLSCGTLSGVPWFTTRLGQGTSGQSLLRLRKHADGNIEQSDLGPVIFVPLLSGMTDQ